MKILIVDDSETLRTQLRKDLEAGQHSVIEAEDGLQGLDSLTKESGIELILCDVNMPRMDGITMCAKIQESPEMKKIPRIMMTTESSPEMKAQGKAAGVTAWITKPYVAEKLLAVIGKLKT